MRFVWPAPAYGVLVNPYANNISETTAQLQQLVDNSYIDEYTNVVFIDMTFYDYLVERQVSGACVTIMACLEANFHSSLLIYRHGFVSRSRSLRGGL